MSLPGGAETLRVQWVPGAQGFGVWVVTGSGGESSESPEVQRWLASADAIFSHRAEVASISMVPATDPQLPAGIEFVSGLAVAQAESAALPHCFLSGRVAGLIGLPDDEGARHWPIERLQQLIELATLKGLVHLWLVADGASPPPAPVRPIPSIGSNTRSVVVSWRQLPGEPVLAQHAISLGVDSAWLLGGESGAQVFVFEMVRELARRSEIARIVCLSDTGAMPGGIADVPKVSSASWSDMRAGRVARLDILHRPYQPGTDVDYRRYHAAARCVAITVLDFIAYDNPAYHESSQSWRRYQRLFDEQVCLADGVFSISEYVGARLERQFAHRLAGSVRRMLLGTDHLSAAPSGLSAAEPPIAGLDGKPFLLVLGNDFEHKNRDFAVKVFCDMNARGYDGELVLAGFHLDGGSSFDHELVGADAVAGRIHRMGSVSGTQKAWLLSRAQAVLYPTSSEGFGLIPFEAGALGTPTAFVSFGPLRETLPGVPASASWQVRPFADHVFALIANPSAQLKPIREASTSLTWRRCVDEMVAGYQALVSDSASWRTHRQITGRGRFWLDAAWYAEVYARRARNKLRRLVAGR